jgi:hypothetical protein
VRTAAEGRCFLLFRCSGWREYEDEDVKQPCEKPHLDVVERVRIQLRGELTDHEEDGIHVPHGARGPDPPPDEHIRAIPPSHLTGPIEASTCISSHRGGGRRGASRIRLVVTVR